MRGLHVHSAYEHIFAHARTAYTTEDTLADWAPVRRMGLALPRWAPVAPPDRRRCRSVVPAGCRERDPRRAGGVGGGANCATSPARVRHTAESGQSGKARAYLFINSLHSTSSDVEALSC